LQKNLYCVAWQYGSNMLYFKGKIKQNNKGGKDER
jgi:hypothetical protein